MYVVCQVCIACNYEYLCCTTTAGTRYTTDKYNYVMYTWYLVNRYQVPGTASAVQQQQCITGINIR